MSTLPTVSSRPPRFNLRAFSTDTDRRFILLIFAISSTSLSIFHYELVTQFLKMQYIKCLDLFLLNPSASTINVGGLPYLCAAQPASQQVGWLFVLELAVFGVAALIYWLFPTWKCWRQELDPLQEDGPLEVRVIEELEKLRQVYIPSVYLHYVWNPNGSEPPLVFGHTGRYYLSLSGKFALSLSDDLEQFRAKILHEMSHIYNKDVDRTYFSLSIWYSFLLIVLLPYSISLIYSAINVIGNPVEIDLLFNVIGRTIIMWLLVFLIRQSFLRSREVYADLQSTQWADSREALERALDTPDSEQKPMRTSQSIQRRLLDSPIGFFVKAIAERWREVSSSHPHSDERKRSIRDPEKIFHLKFWEAFAIGISFGMAFPSLHDIFGMIGQLLLGWLRMTFPVDSPDLGTLFLCLLLVLLIGQMIWRAMLVTRIEGQELRGVGRIGLCVAAGLVLGFFFSLYFVPLSVFYKANVQILFLYLLPWVLLLALGLFGFCKWLALVISHWLEVVNTQRFFQLVFRVSFVIAGLILVVALALFWYLLQASVGFLLPEALNLTILTQPIVLQPIADIDFYWRFMLQAFFVLFLPQYSVFLALACLWVLPLISGFWYRRSIPVRTLQWASIDDPPSQQNLTPVQSPFRLRSAVYIALVGSFIFCGLLLAIRLQSVELTTTLESFLLAMLFQAIIAAIIAMRVKPPGIVSGLFGAFLSGCLMAIGTLAIYFFVGGVGPDAPKIIFLYEVNWGTIGTLIIIMIISILQSGLRVQHQLKLVLRPKSHAQLKRRLFVFVFVIAAIILLPIFAKLVSSSQPQVKTNIVKNGDFEEPMVLLNSLQEYNAEQSFGAWIVASGSIYLVGTYWLPAHGAQSVDLNGPTAGIIYQDLPTRPSATYSLSFAMAGNPVCVAPATKQMQVWWGSTLVATLSFNVTGHSWNSMGWQHYTYKVQATGPVTRLSFISLTPSPCGPALDDVTAEG